MQFVVVQAVFGRLYSQTAAISPRTVHTVRPSVVAFLSSRNNSVAATLNMTAALIQEKPSRAKQTVEIRCPHTAAAAGVTVLAAFHSLVPEAVPGAVHVFAVQALSADCVITFFARLDNAVATAWKNAASSDLEEAIGTSEAVVGPVRSAGGTADVTLQTGCVGEEKTWAAGQRTSAVHQDVGRKTFSAGGWKAGLTLDAADGAVVEDLAGVVAVAVLGHLPVGGADGAVCGMVVARPCAAGAGRVAGRTLASGHVEEGARRTLAQR
jgi:hypothetical protein